MAIDPTGERKLALEAFLEVKRGQGFEIETQTDTHAIVLKRNVLKSVVNLFRRSDSASRYVVSVDERGGVTMVAAEPKRS